MPTITGERLQRILRSRLGTACCVEVEHGGEEIVLVPEVRACTVADLDSIENAYRVQCRAMESERHLEQMRRDYLRRERESHSTHLDLPVVKGESTLVARQAAVPASYAEMPATILMPMARH